MRWLRFESGGRPRIGYLRGSEVQPVVADALQDVMAGRGTADAGAPLRRADVKVLAPLRPGKIVCVGLNYMPKMQGFDVLAALKASPETAAIPVIVLSNLGQDSDVQLARERGAADYIIKSNIALESLVERVRAFFTQRAA